MKTSGVFNPTEPAKEIVEVLAKYNTPINLIDSVFGLAQSFAHQSTIVQSLGEGNKKAAAVRERQSMFVSEDSGGIKGLRSNSIHPECDHYHPNQTDVERG